MIQGVVNMGKLLEIIEELEEELKDLESEVSENERN